MAKKKKETTTTKDVIKEQVVEETPKVDLSKFDSKDDPDVIKLDLDNKTGDDKVSDTEEKSVIEEVKVQDDETKKDEENETPVIEEITEDVSEEVEETASIVEEAITESMETGEELPENIQKLMDFMDETGGDLSDYVKLNQDYGKLENQDLLYEYYKQTKPHLNNEEINFLMEDRFSYDEDTDDERDIRRKKLALKEQVADAKSHLDGQKSKYYEDIKAGSKLTSEQQKAVNFFNRYNKESESTQKLQKKNTEVFEQKTNNLFNDKFKGFEYNVGDKKFRFNVKDIDGVKKTQSDLNGFMAKFVDKNLSLTDAKGYHKSLFSAMNSDAIANHFYEQGKADAMKDSVAKAKNVNMNPRQSHGEIEAGGIKVRVLGDDSSDFKFKIKNQK